jgi:hypothetical protein
MRIQMNFYSNPSGITSQDTFLAPRYFERPAKNPLFEVISSLGPLGPLGNKNFLAPLHIIKLKPTL